MASGASDYFENKMLGLLIGQTAFTVPATLYVGLWTTTLSDTSTGATAGEPAGGSYARVAVTNNTTNFPTPSSGSTSNGTTITFPTASASWGTITHVGITDSPTTGAGNLLIYASLTTSPTVNTSDTVIFAASALTLTLT
jgi:hypothetical protein